MRERVPSLNIFDTIGEMITSPVSVMQRVVMAEQKNYVWLLQTLFGFAYIMFIFWYGNTGIYFDNLLSILGVGLILGPIAGIVSINLIIAIGVRYLIPYRKWVTIRDLRGILSYSLVPVILSVIFVLPVELGIYGMALFTKDPSPMVLNPNVWIILLLINGTLIVYTLILCAIGLYAIGNGLFKSIISTLAIALILFIPAVLLNRMGADAL